MVSIWILGILIAGLYDLLAKAAPSRIFLVFVRNAFPICTDEIGRFPVAGRFQDGLICVKVARAAADPRPTQDRGRDCKLDR
jgi:hypothetical protein